MPLKLKDVNRVKKQKAKEQAKPKKRKRKERGPTVSKFYSDISEFKYAEADLTFDKLQYKHIIYCELQSVNLPDGSIEIENSWIGLLLLMVDTVRANHPDDFLNVLMENEITTQQFCIDTKYGKYNFEEEGYRAFNLYNSGYYLEAVFNVENIFWSIFKLLKCLNIALDKINFKLVNKEYNAEEIKLVELEEETDVVSIGEALPFFKKGIHLVNMCITDTHIKLHRVELVLTAFCNYVYDNFGNKEGLSKLKQSGNTRVSTYTDNESSSCMEIRNSGIYIYSDCEPDSIIEFICDSINKLGMSKQDIKLYFRKLKKKEEKAEWEID